MPEYEVSKSEDGPHKSPRWGGGKSVAFPKKNIWGGVVNPHPTMGVGGLKRVRVGCWCLGIGELCERM